MTSRCYLLPLLLIPGLVSLVGCGDGGYTKNAETSAASGDTSSKSADAEQNETTESDPDAESSNAGNENGGESSDDASIGTPETIFDQLAEIFGNAGKQGGIDANGENSTGPAPEPTSDDCIDADEFTCAVEVAITHYSNQLRPAASPLAHDARLSYTSRDWSKTQAANNSIGHSGFPSARIKHFYSSFPGVKVNILAENVAMSSAGSSSADAVAKMFVNMWANSSGHRRNILGNYKILGVGIYKNGNRFYATQIFGTE